MRQSKGRVLALNLYVGVKRRHIVTAALLAWHADIAHHATNAAARDQDARAFNPNSIKLIKKVVVIVIAPSCRSFGEYSFRVQYGGEVTTRCNNSARYPSKIARVPLVKAVHRTIIWRWPLHLTKHTKIATMQLGQTGRRSIIDRDGCIPRAYAFCDSRNSRFAPTRKFPAPRPASWLREDRCAWISARRFPFLQHVHQVRQFPWRLCHASGHGWGATKLRGGVSPDRR